MKLSVALLWSNPGPSAACRLAGAGPIPCYQHGLSREVWASSKPSVAHFGATLGHQQHVIRQVLGPLLVMPVSRGAGPILCHQHGPFSEGPGQFNAIGSTTLEPLWAISSASFSRFWANSMPLAMPISRGAGPIPCCRHGLFREGLGQLKATSSLTLEQLWAISSMLFGRCWANSMPLAMPVSREAGSIPCYWHCLFREQLCNQICIECPELCCRWP